MKELILTGLLMLAAFGVTGCAQKDENGNPTPSSFSSTGMFNRQGGDVVVGGH